MTLGRGGRSGLKLVMQWDGKLQSKQVMMLTSFCGLKNVNVSRAMELNSLITPDNKVAHELQHQHKHFEGLFLLLIHLHIDEA